MNKKTTALLVLPALLLASSLVIRAYIPARAQAITPREAGTRNALDLQVKRIASQDVRRLAVHDDVTSDVASPYSFIRAYAPASVSRSRGSSRSRTPISPCTTSTGPACGNPS